MCYQIFRRLESRNTGLYPRAARTEVSGSESLRKQAPEATENSSEGFSLDRLTLETRLLFTPRSKKHLKKNFMPEVIVQKGNPSTGL
jgi:hypothetical protein